MLHWLLLALGSSLSLDHLVVGAALKVVLLLVGILLLKLLIHFDCIDVGALLHCQLGFAKAVVGRLAPNQLCEPVSLFGSHVDLVHRLGIENGLHHFLFVHHVVGVFGNQLPKVALPLLEFAVGLLGLLFVKPFCERSHHHEVLGDGLDNRPLGLLGCGPAVNLKNLKEVQLRDPVVVVGVKEIERQLVKHLTLGENID